MSTQVDIHGIAAGGDGVGRTDNMVVFVPRTAPGDVAQVSLVQSKRFARGTLMSLDVASPLRTEPACVHYTRDRCGGCQLQHVNYDAQLDAKASIIGDSIRRIGRREWGAVPVLAADAQWQYRRKLTLHLRRVGSEWIAGLHSYDDPSWVFDLVECPITEQQVLDVWAQLRPTFDTLPPAPALRVAVKVVDSLVSVVVEGGSAWPASEAFFAQNPVVSEVWWRPAVGRLRKLHARREGSAAGASFVQVNARVAAELRNRVLERVRSYAPETVVDAYAGSGETSVPLSRQSTVTAIEVDESASRQLGARLKPPSKSVTGRVEDHIDAALPADLVILNPPRTGVDARVSAALQSVPTAPRALFYVSCDPATLSRDLARMPRYRLVDVRAYDMFPQTAHVETVCELVPGAA